MALDTDSAQDARRYRPSLVTTTVTRCDWANVDGLAQITAEDDLPGSTLANPGCRFTTIRRLTSARARHASTQTTPHSSTTHDHYHDYHDHETTTTSHEHPTTTQHQHLTTTPLLFRQHRTTAFHRRLHRTTFPDRLELTAEDHDLADGRSRLRPTQTLPRN